MKIAALAMFVLLAFPACNSTPAPATNVAADNLVDADITEVPDETMPANAAANVNANASVNGVDPD